jgi:tRNA U34 5-methylaminomethyl-2-thiouridine-forming methyltransferase MnmC
MGENPGEIEWRGGVPVSRRFGDPYFSFDGGLAETRHVFLAGNRLPQRFRDGFRIAELGFGTGLNFAATVAAWYAAGAPGRLTYTSFEAFPIPAVDRLRALSAFPALAGGTRGGLTHNALGDQENLIESDRKSAHACPNLRLVVGDARNTLPAWEGLADAWFLDGFAPAKNPEMWGEALLAEVARHTAPGGTFATYTAAGSVRRALAAAGFEVERLPGFGRKRHMTRGVLR